LRFSFVAPEGFQLQNSPTAVIGVDKSGHGMKFDAGKITSSGNMRDYLAREWAKELKIKNLSKINSFDLDGLPAVSAGTSAKAKDGKQVDVGLAAIKVGADKVYRFMFVSPGGLDSKRARGAKATVESFKVLSATEAAGYKPKRLKLVRVGPNDTKAGLAQQMAVDDLLEEQFAVLNGLADGERPEVGSLVKLVSE